MSEGEARAYVDNPNKVVIALPFPVRHLRILFLSPHFPFLSFLSMEAADKGIELAQPTDQQDKLIYINDRNAALGLFARRRDGTRTLPV